MKISRNLHIFVHVIISVYFHRYHTLNCQCLQLRWPPKEGYLNKNNCEKYFAFAIILEETFFMECLRSYSPGPVRWISNPDSLLVNHVTICTLLPLQLNVFFLKMEAITIPSSEKWSKEKKGSGHEACAVTKDSVFRRAHAWLNVLL